MSDEFIPNSTVSSIREAAKVSTATSLPVADFSPSDTTTESMIIRRDVAVMQPADKNVEILVDAKSINRCRQKLGYIKNNQCVWTEVFLGVAAAGIGIIASAYLADIKIDSAKGIFSFVITPCLTVGSGVAYLIYRKENYLSSTKIANEILEELPNPDDAVGVEVKR